MPKGSASRTARQRRNVRLVVSQDSLAQAVGSRQRRKEAGVRQPGGLMVFTDIDANRPSTPEADGVYKRLAAATWARSRHPMGREHGLRFKSTSLTEQLVNHPAGDRRTVFGTKLRDHNTGRSQRRVRVEHARRSPALGVSRRVSQHLLGLRVLAPAVAAGTVSRPVAGRGASHASRARGMTKLCRVHPYQPVIIIARTRRFVSRSSPGERNAMLAPCSEQRGTNGFETKRDEKKKLKKKTMSHIYVLLTDIPLRILFIIYRTRRIPRRWTSTACSHPRLFVPIQVTRNS